MTTPGDSLVLAGGGSAGIAWELGLLAGIEEREPELMAELRAPSTTLIGTSAGSVVAAGLSSTRSVAELLQPELDFRTAPLRSGFGRLVRLTASMVLAGIGSHSPEQTRRRIGAFATRAETMSSAEWRDSIASRLVDTHWPERPLKITAVDTESGELRVFDDASGVDFVDAVSASCAVPGIFPPVLLAGRRYMDGGMRSIANADLAAGSRRVLILAPLLRSAGMGSIAPSELDALGDAQVTIVDADGDSKAAFGRNPLDASVRPASAAAGRDQGHRIAPQIAELWRAGDRRTVRLH